MGDMVVVDSRCQFGWRSSPGFGPYSHPLLSTRTHILPFRTLPSCPRGWLQCSMLNWFRRRMAVLPFRCRMIVSKLLVLAGSPVLRFSSDITWTTGCWLQGVFIRTDAGLYVRCSQQLPTISACWVAGVPTTHHSCHRKRLPTSRRG